MGLSEALGYGGGAALLLFLGGVVGGRGALVGVVLVVFLNLRGGYPALGVLSLLVLGGHSASSWRRERKRALGVAQEHGGRRGSLHALANVGPSLTLLWALPLPGAQVASLAALAAAFSDTIASEIGMGFAWTPRKLLFGSRMAAGSDGAMSLPGTFSGACAAGLAGILAEGLGGDGIGWCVAVGGFLGNFIDSILGLTIETRLPPPLANHIVNAAASLAGGGLGYLLFHLQGGG